MSRTARKKHTPTHRAIPFLTGLCVGAVAALLYFAVLWYVCFLA